MTTDVSALSGAAGTAATDRSSEAFAEMGSEQFLKLLITQLSNQDPFEPTSNEEMMRQISMIRDIEMSTSIADAMSALTGQQKFGAATSMIGRYVRSQPLEDGRVLEGVVTSLRLDAGGKAVLRLSSGVEVPLEQVSEVQAPAEAAGQLVGRRIVATDRRTGGASLTVEGEVTGVAVDELGEVLLKVGEGDVRLRDVVSVA